jgi:hypothetical protein
MSVVQDTVRTVIYMKRMRGEKEKTLLAIRRVSWEQKSNVRGTSFGPLPGTTLVEAERSQICYTSTLNRVVSRPLKFCLLQMCYESVFSVLTLSTQQRPLTTSPAVCHLRTAVYCQSRFSFVRTIIGLWNHYDNSVCVYVFVDMHVTDVRVLSAYVYVGLFTHVYMYVRMYVHAHVHK